MIDLAPTQELLDTQRRLIDSQQDQIAYIRKVCEDKIAEIQTEAKREINTAQYKQWQAEAALHTMTKDRDEWEQAFYQMERSKYPVKEAEAKDIIFDLYVSRLSVRDVAERHYRSCEAIRKVRKAYLASPDLQLNSPLANAVRDAQLAQVLGGRHD